MKKLAGNEDLFGTQDEQEKMELELKKWQVGILSMYNTNNCTPGVCRLPFERICNNNVQLV